MKTNLSFLKLRIIVFFLAVASIYTSSSAQWVRVSDGFQFRSDLSESIVYNSKLYTFLGFHDHYRNTDQTSEAYDPATDTYTLLAPIPDTASETHEKVVLIDNTVWLIGGRVGQNPGPLTSAVWIYNITTDSWSKGPQLKDPATNKPLLWAAGGAALLGRTLHIFGGFIIDACNHDQSKYHLTLDVDSWLADTTQPADWKNELAPLPIKRNHFSTIVLGGKIYAIGGQFGHDCGGGLEKPFSHVYDPATDSWKQLPLLPEARSHAEGGSFAIDGKIYIVGGQGEDGASTDEVTIFDPAGNNGAGAWKNDTSFTLPERYEGGTAKIINSTFIYSHGGEGTSANPRKKTYIRPVVRSPKYELGFSKGCLQLNADSGTAVTGSTLLFTIDSSTNYSTSSNADWLTVTKNAAGTATPSAVDIEITANTAGLAPGRYNGTITAAGIENDTTFLKATYCVSLTVKSNGAASNVLEAEKATLNGVKISRSHAGFSGSGFADYVNPARDYIEWTFNKPESDSALLIFRYSNGKDTDRALQLEVNGVAIDSILSFSSTGSWTHWDEVTTNVRLNAGSNTVRLTAIGNSGPNIDYLIYTNNSSNASLRKAALKSIVGKSAHLLKAYVLPNPASGNAKLMLRSSSALPVNAEIIDMSGRLYKKFSFFVNGSGKCSFSVNDISSGMYFIRVRQGNELKTLKLIVANKTAN